MLFYQNRSLTYWTRNCNSRAARRKEKIKSISLWSRVCHRYAGVEATGTPVISRGLQIHIFICHGKPVSGDYQIDVRIECITVQALEVMCHKHVKSTTSADATGYNNRMSAGLNPARGTMSECLSDISP